jgi:hypothetical protein
MPRDGRMHSVSTVPEIEEAIAKLPSPERDALESRLLARRLGLDAITGDELAQLIASLDEAERQIDNGQTHTGDDLRGAIRSWLGK